MQWGFAHVLYGMCTLIDCNYEAFGVENTVPFHHYLSEELKSPTSFDRLWCNAVTSKECLDLQYQLHIHASSTKASPVKCKSTRITSKIQMAFWDLMIWGADKSHDGILDFYELLASWRILEGEWGGRMSCSRWLQTNWRVESWLIDLLIQPESVAKGFNSFCKHFKRMETVTRWCSQPRC